MMTKKDFEAIAGALRLAWQASAIAVADHETGEQASAYATSLAFVASMTMALQGANPRFDMERFVTAVGLDKESFRAIGRPE